MPQETISVYASPAVTVDGVGAYHTSIVYTDLQGNAHQLEAGPVFNSDMEDFQLVGSEHNFDSGRTYAPTVVEVATGTDLSSVWAEMEQTASNINNSSIPYAGLADNCNAFTKTLLDSAALATPDMQTFTPSLNEDLGTQYFAQQPDGAVSDEVVVTNANNSVSLWTALENGVSNLGSQIGDLLSSFWNLITGNESSATVNPNVGISRTSSNTANVEYNGSTVGSLAFNGISGGAGWDGGWNSDGWDSGGSDSGPYDSSDRPCTSGRPGEQEPLVLSLNGHQIELTSLAQSGVSFDFTGAGTKDKTGWVGADTGILVYDKNGDGAINNGTEMLGDHFAAGADNGFAALATLDSNHDGVIDANDPAFAHLQVWVDSNDNGITDPGELESLSQLGIQSISLATTAANETVAGNQVSAVSTVTFTDGTTQTVDEVNFQGAAPSANNQVDQFDFGAGQQALSASTDPSASTEVDFGSGIADNDMWLQRNGNDLAISILGTTDRLTIAGWYSANTPEPTELKLSDGAEIDSSGIAQLVQAMATYAGETAGFDPTQLGQLPNDPTLQTAVAANWHQQPLAA